MRGLLVTSLPRLVESLRSAPIVRMNDYEYFVHPLTDGFPALDKPMLEEVAEALAHLLPQGTDRLVAPEAMGLPVTTALTLRTGIPYTVARKRTYGIPGEVAVPYNTGYAQGTLTLNGVRPGHRVVIVDDVVSRGGTLRAVASAVRKAGGSVERILVVVNKSPQLGPLAEAIGAPIEALVDVCVKDGLLEVLRAR